MKLFAFYIGGRTATSLIEVHDVRLCAGETIEDCHDDIRRHWWGTPESLHLDVWGELAAADGHAITLSREPFAGDGKLWFVNLGGYEAGDFGELHKNVFVVAPTESKARVRALKKILDWKSRHKDNQYDVENILNVGDSLAGQGLHIHLRPDDGAASSFSFGFNPAIRKTA